MDKVANSRNVSASPDMVSLEEAEGIAPRAIPKKLWKGVLQTRRKRFLLTLQSALPIDYHI